MSKSSTNSIVVDLTSDDEGSSRRRFSVGFTGGMLPENGRVSIKPAASGGARLFQNALFKRPSTGKAKLTSAMDIDSPRGMRSDQQPRNRVILRE